jgi:hypothetical protein
MPWDCRLCRYERHAVQQEKSIRHLEQELKAARYEVTKVKAVIGSSGIVEQADLVTGSNLKTPKPGATGSLLMMPLNSN